MDHIRLPAWFRRGLEAGILAVILSLLTVVVLSWDDRGPGALILPGGIGGVVIMALPVLSIGVLAVVYPVALAATRGDAILGAITGWIVAADLLAILTVLMQQRVLLLGAGITIPFGILAGILAAPAALGGLLAAVLFTPFGFGRRAGRAAAIGSGLVATAMLVLVVPIVA